MSSAAIVVAGKNGKLDKVHEYRNSWLGAAYIWNALFNAYVPKQFEHDAWILDEGKRLWALADDPRLTEAERIALLLTFDNCLIAKKEMARVADALDQFAQRYPAPSHLPAWATALRIFAKDPTVTALGFHHTSVSENPWYEYVDDEHSDGRPYNIRTGKRHWFILDRVRE